MTEHDCDKNGCPSLSQHNTEPDHRKRFRERFYIEDCNDTISGKEVRADPEVILAFIDEEIRKAEYAAINSWKPAIERAAKADERAALIEKVEGMVRDFEGEPQALGVLSHLLAHLEGQSPTQEETECSPNYCPFHPSATAWGGSPEMWAELTRKHENHKPRTGASLSTDQGWELGGSPRTEAPKEHEHIFCHRCKGHCLVCCELQLYTVREKKDK